MKMTVISENTVEHLNVILKYFSVKCDSQVSSASESVKVITVLVEFELYQNWSKRG
jgi:hypothetical protein